MKFSDARSRIQNGDVFLFEGRSPFAWLIKWWTRSKYSHAGCALWVAVNGHRKLCILESLEPHGVRLYPMERYVEECTARGIKVHWYELDAKGASGVNRDHVAEYVLDQLGKRYASPWQFFVSWGWLTRWVRRLFGKTIEALDPERFFCSQLVSAALRAGGYDPAPEDDFVEAATEPGAIAGFTCLRSRGVLIP